MQEQEILRGVLAPAIAAAEDAAGLAMMRLSLFDWAACGLAGAAEPVARVVRDLVEAEGGRAQATLIGGGRAPMRAAALMNGTASHALDYDDTHFAHIGHPSVAVIPAALAMAETQGATLAQMLRAALVGCEASIRFGLWFGRGHYQVGFHQTATAGAFGAALAAARLRTPDPEVHQQALALVSTRAAGVKSQFGTMGKPFNAGQAASNGVEAAWLASAGFLSASEAFTGQNGFLATHHCDGSATPPPGVLMTTVSHKFHACCHGLHAMLEAIGALDVEARAVTQVQVATHPRWLSVCDISAPRSGLEAKFSYRLAAAMALSGIDTGAMASFDDSVATDPALCALRDKVQVTGDAGLSEMQARVHVFAGAAHEAFHDLAAPMTPETRAQKLRAKAAALIGDARAEALWRAAQGDDLAALVACLADGSGAPLTR